MGDDLGVCGVVKRYLYTGFTPVLAMYIARKASGYRLSEQRLKEWAQSPEFADTILSVNDDAMHRGRFAIFSLLARAITLNALPENVRIHLKSLIFKCIKSDEDFFKFIQLYTVNRRKEKIPTQLRKLIIQFYKTKSAKELAVAVATCDSCHGWRHRDLIKLTHLKAENSSTESVIKYALFGVEKLGDSQDEIDVMLRKSHELRTTDDVKRAVSLIEELEVTVDQVNSKLNKNEEVWLAAIPHMSTRQLLQNLHKLYKLGFLKNSKIQQNIIENLTNIEKIKKSNLHPIEVFIYMKIFEKGGKPIDKHLVQYLNMHEVTEKALKKIQNPIEPKCKLVFQNINRCLKLSYENVKPSDKRFFITIDVTAEMSGNCYCCPRISCFDAIMTFVRYLTKLEKSVTVAVFKDNTINLIDIVKSSNAVEKLTEHKSNYILPAAPLDWAKNKKKQYDVFVNFMASNYRELIPEELDKIEKISEALKKYTTKLKLPETRVIRIFLDAFHYGEKGKNILTITGLSLDVPNIFDAFVRGRFS